ncbi:GAF domain-containing sensor histidine kinase [Rubrobacter indicoceani]|uniref:sensor histidine kinase n=1 Tax=Rubrobacter indicoceani TaxID=2051957 RepID=UPI000E5B4A98|nr:GAF domain-containing sensor histidine kinase [Rubrobacter indicoceani]
MREGISGSNPGGLNGGTGRNPVPGLRSFPSGGFDPADELLGAAFETLVGFEGRTGVLISPSGVCVRAGAGAAEILGLEGEIVGENLAGRLWPGRETPPDEGSCGPVRYRSRPVHRRTASDKDRVLLGFIVTAQRASGRSEPENHRGDESEELRVLRSEVGALRTLHEASVILDSTLEVEEIGPKLLRLMRGVFGLTAAVIDTEDEEGRIKIRHASGLDSLWTKARFAGVAEEARRRTLQMGEMQTFRLHRPASAKKSGVPASVFALYLPLRVQEQVVGLLEAYGEEPLNAPHTTSILSSLATQAASALENARLYRELSAREARLEDLISRLLNAQEEERRRVAYEVHDGLAQTVAAAHHHLQAYARLRGPEGEETHGALEGALRLVKRTVGEARRVIAHLRPTTLDDFGLQTALRMEVDELRAEGWSIGFAGRLEESDRISSEVETALFRVAQQAVNNISKHAGTKEARITLSRFGDGVRLRVRDRGRGFAAGEIPPTGEAGKATGRAGTRVGVASMRERVALLGGTFRLLSRPGAGTLVCVEVPLFAGTDFGRTTRASEAPSA